MSFPNVIYGDYGDEKVAQSAAIGNLPLGKLMILPDGTKCHLARCGSAASLLAGQLTSTLAEVAGHGNVSGSGLLASVTTTYNAVGDTSVILLSQSAAITKDQYAGGLLNVLGPAASTYIGHVYRIKGNLSCAVSAKATITLETNDPLKVAFKAGSTLCSLRKSPYADQVVFDGATVVAPPMGATPVAVSTSFYYWAVTRGLASLLQSATVVVTGGPIQPAVSAAGSVTTVAATAGTAGGYGPHAIGFALGAAAASQAVLCYLTLE